MEKIAKDKRLIFVFCFLIFFILFYNLYYSREMKDISKLRKEIKNNQDIIDSGLVINNEIKEIDSELKIINERLNRIRVMFPPRFNHDEILIDIRDAAQKAGLKIESIKYSDVEKIQETGDAVQGNQEDNTVKSNMSDSAEYEDLTEGKEDTAAEVSVIVLPVEIKDNKLKEAVEKMGLNTENIEIGKNKETQKNKLIEGKGFSLILDISSKGTNSQIKDFIKNVMNLEKRVVFHNTQINKSNDDILAVRFQLQFLGIHDSKAPYKGVEFEPSTSGNKDDIFKSYEGYVELENEIVKGANSGINNTDKSNLDASFYDFTMRVMPFGEDMAPPTVSIVGRNLVSGIAGSKIPVIYGDNREVERVELYIEENNGKFLCKFKTEHETFPDKNYQLLEEFRPFGGEIKFLIDSTRRLSQKDISGVNLSLVNKTTKKLMVDVVNDDTGRPRVKIEHKEGTIEVNYR